MERQLIIRSRVFATFYAIEKIIGGRKMLCRMLHRPDLVNQPFLQNLET